MSLSNFHLFWERGRGKGSFDVKQHFKLYVLANLDSLDLKELPTLTGCCKTKLDEKFDA